MQRILNFGSFMQSLALKNMLETLGHEVIFIDFKPCKNIDEIVKSKGNIITNFRTSVLYKKIIKFYQKHILNIDTVSEYEKNAYKRYSSCYDMLNITDKEIYNTSVDVLIIGSDEVFNCFQINDIGYNLKFFGKKSRCKKLTSYAASFGNTTIERINNYNKANELAKYLKKFNYISVRDANSYNIIKKLTGIEPQIHFDPVLVGEIEKLHLKKVDLSGYIGVYGYRGRFTDEEINQIKQFAKITGLKTVSLFDELDFCDININCCPDEILSYIKNADYIITDTFHGTIFSVIMHVPFAIICRDKTNDGYTNSEKLLDLINKLNIQDRLLTNSISLSEIFDNSIDFYELDKIRTFEKKRSMNYLSKITS